jgi:serine/threonine protein kinase
MAHLAKGHEEATLKMAEASDEEEMDRIPINLLRFRAQQSMASLNVHEQSEDEDDNDITTTSTSKVDELQGRSSHHHCSRSEVLNAQTDGGEGQPSLLPTRSFRSSEGTVTTVDELRSMCSKEFRTSAMPDQSGDLPRFLMEEIVFGKTLGEGAFASVREIQTLLVQQSCKSFKRSTSPSLSETIESFTKTSSVDSDSDPEDSLFDEEEAQTRKVLADHCIRANGYARFVVKKLRPDILKDETRMLTAISDLARETFFLKRIRHPNIIRLRAVSYKSEFDENYFLVLDRLDRCLPSLLDVWSKEKKQSNGVFDLFRGRKNLRSRKHKLKDNIVTVCFELSSALSHLHQHGIVYRDLKPANVGFDFNGNLRLFDFGLAKEILSTEVVGTNGVYHLTQMCGTPRYMAPEVANGHPYGPSCDVYSFALLCWQMASLRHPYDRCTIDDLQRRVWMTPHQRPPIREVWPVYFRQILTRGWSEKWAERLSMKEIESILAEQVGIFNESFDLEQHLMSPRRSTLAVVGGLGLGDLYLNL